MREIKFALYFHDVESDCIVRAIHSFELTDKRLHIMLASFKENTIIGFCQFIGQKDKHEMDVYEGDVIGLETLHGIKPAWVVEYHPRYVSFRTRDINRAKPSCVAINANFFSNYQVIGNIYQNPELLKP